MDILVQMKPSRVCVCRVNVLRGTNQFSVVSRAFQILSDADKKTKYDRFGGDPDSRFPSSSAPQASPFSGGFARPPGAGMGGQNFFYEDEISPEELFNRFFGGGMGGMGGGFPFGKSNVVAQADHL